MGQNVSKQKLDAINREVKGIQVSIKNHRHNINARNRLELQKNLVNYSAEINSLSKNVRRKHIDDAQKFVSKVTKELLDDEIHLDSAAVETNSFIHVPSEQQQQIIKSSTTKNNKKSQQKIITFNNNQTKVANNNRENTTTIIDIENKLNSMKPQIISAIKNNDSNQLFMQQKTIKTLATELELIPVEDYIALTENKEALEKNLSRYYQKIEKARKQLSRNDNIQYLTELQERETIKKQLNNLLAIENKINSVVNLTKNELIAYQNQINSFKGLNEEMSKRKAEVLEKLKVALENIEESEQQAAIITIENNLLQIEIDQEKFKNQLNLEKIEDLEKFTDYLQKTKENVTNLPSLNSDIIERKDDYLKYIEASLRNLEEKIGDLQRTSLEKIKSAISISKSLQDTKTIDGFYAYWKSLEGNLPPKNSNLDEIRQIQKLLEDLVVSINAKLRQFNLSRSSDEIFLRNIDEIDNPLLKTNVKIFNLPSVSNLNIETNNKVREIKNELQHIKDRVDRFTGTYKNVFFCEIESRLNDCLRRAKEEISNQNDLKEIQNLIENYLNILEHRSIKDRQYDQDSLKKSSTLKKIKKIQNNFENIKNEMRSSGGDPRNITTRLNECLEDLNKIQSIDGDDGDKENLHKEITRYIHSIQLATIENKFFGIKPKINSFIGLENTETFFALDEQLIRSTLELDAFNFEKGSELYNRKIKLMQEIQTYCEILDERAKQTQQIVEMEKEIDGIMKKIDLFTGNDGDYEDLDEKLINLNVKLGKLDVNHQELLESRKNRLLATISECYRRLDEVVNKGSGDCNLNNNGGTIV